MEKTLYRVAIIDKDNSEKLFWTGAKFSKNVTEAWTAEQKKAESEVKKVKDEAEKAFGCPCPYDTIIEDTDGREWYIPGGGRLDA